MRRTALLTLLVVVGCVPIAAAAERWRLASVPLDMPMDDGLDNQALEGLYQADYGTNMPHNVGGFIASVENGKLTAQQAVLIDLGRARTVFDLGDAK